MTIRSLPAPRLRGCPVSGTFPEAGDKRHFPADGALMLPMMTLDLAAFESNIRLMFDHAERHGAVMAPHAKTPMSPRIARRLLDAGAWGTTVADIRQLAVMLDAGLPRLILANGIGGRAAARRLAEVLRGKSAEVWLFLDNVETYEALCAAWAEHSDLPPLGLLIEIGTVRGGLREDDAALALARRVASGPGTLRLAGVAVYEGASAVADPEESCRRIDALLDRALRLIGQIRAITGPEPELILSAGGSAWFDRVLTLLAPVLQDPNSLLVLRSGAIYFFDHGVYERGLLAMQARGGHPDGHFVPALRIWAEVISAPEPELAICGMGMRDVAIDQDMPRPLTLWRDGQRLHDLTTTRVTRLNDQHAFLDAAGADLYPGDVIEFGLSHPCTCIDRYRVIWALDDEGYVVEGIDTFFG